MKKDKKYILEYVNSQDTSSLSFGVTDYFDHIVDSAEDREYVDERLKCLKKLATACGRVNEILILMDEFATIDKNGKLQCRVGANRSALDIWRVYNNYFKPVSIFYIMRILYKLVIEEEELGTLFCHDIDKQVFYLAGGCDDIESITTINEFNLPFAEWRTVGLGD